MEQELDEAQATPWVGQRGADMPPTRGEEERDRVQLSIYLKTL